MSFSLHVWKVCVRQKCTVGSNPTLSAIKAYYQLFTRLAPNFTPNNVRLGVFFSYPIDSLF